MTRSAQIARAKCAYKNYAVSCNHDLSDVYASFSEAKSASFKAITREMNTRNGFDMRIISHNSMVYTCGYQFVDPDTGVIMFVYHTPTYSVAIESPTR